MRIKTKYIHLAINHNITIRNCLMQFGHGAIVLGSEMSGGVKNLKVERCYFDHTDRGLRIKTRRGRGNTAVIDGVEQRIAVSWQAPTDIDFTTPEKSFVYTMVLDEAFAVEAGVEMPVITLRVKPLMLISELCSIYDVIKK